MTTTERYERLALNVIVASKTNPRTHFDGGYLAELAGSIRDKGVIQPILVRQIDAGSHKPMKFEIIAGECRYRASILAEQLEIPAVIRQYSDEQVLELQLVENIHRQDLTALEQAAGYRALIKSNPDKHSAASIAQRIGMSEAWVWDRLKLNDLVAPAKQLLEHGKMAVGHAILIARQKGEDQLRIIDPGQEILFVPLEHGLEFDGVTDPTKKPGKYDDVKPVSVRELEAGIAHHIRFDITHAAKAVPLQFEEAATRVSEAEAKPGRGKKVIAITFAERPSEDAKDESERTYGWRSWKRADGTKKTQRGGYGRPPQDAPTCDHSVLGTVVAGDEHYGETFTVCVNRDKCRVHWGKEIGEREKNQKLRESGKPKQAARSEQAAAARRAKEQEKERQAEAQWKELSAVLRKAVRAAADKTPASLSKGVFALVLSFHRLPKDTKPAGLQKALLQSAVDRHFDSYMFRGHLPTYTTWAKALGVDITALKPKAESKPAKAKKGKAAA